MNKETIDITSDKIDLFSFFTPADQLPKKDTLLDRKIIYLKSFQENNYYKKPFFYPERVNII